jgi:hypothetical protein
MAGAGYKLFNTGDVLTAAQVNTYLMEQTVMVFADAAARTTALTGVVSEGMISYLKDTNAVEVYNGSAWVASDDPNAIQNTIVDAKGDLITATAADTPARLAVGSNGETLVADSAATTGLRWQGNYAAGKNALINGDFNIWQRGTSFSLTSTAGYTADRWVFDTGGSGVVTVSRQAFTAGQTDVPGNPTYFLQAAFSTSGSSATMLQQRIENVSTFAGQTITYSMWARVNSGTAAVGFQWVQDFGSGGSVAASGNFGSFTLTTSWQRISATVTLSSISGKTIGTNSNLVLRLAPFTSGTATYSFANVQAELGNVATAFQTATGTLQGELAACQRYYFRIVGDPSANYPVFGTGFGSATGFVQCYITHPVTMRVEPTALDYSTVAVYDGASVIGSPTSVTLNGDIQSKNVSMLDFAKSGSFTQYRPYSFIGNANTGAYVGLSAEL